jgi:cytochrome c-type biogenesis protein CcmH
MRAMRTAAALLALTALAAAMPAASAVAAPRATLSEIEAEVMCPVCGTLLELAESPQARREKVFVSKLIATGKTKGEIKEALVAQYGNAVLALPRGSGFDLSAYLVPIVAFLVAAAALAFGVARWRRAAGAGSAKPPAAEGPSEEEAERLDADLARYDL